MKTVGAVVFPGFQMLDLYGPLDMFGMLGDDLTMEIVARDGEALASTPGPKTRPDSVFADGRAFDIVLIPGGRGTRDLVSDDGFLSDLRALCERAEIVATVCTGSAVLARTGLLDGRRATSNKAAFGWVVEQGPDVDWQPKARWVVDERYYTSSGVSAGMDMALALVSDLFGNERARRAATHSEYRWIDDPSDDPFAAIQGLTSE